MMRAGLPAVEALRAATVRGAAAVGLAARVGRIAPGFAADLIAVDQDPTANPAALGRVPFLMIAGDVLRAPPHAG